MGYQHRNYDKAAVKSYIMENYPCEEVITAFEKVDYDLEKFFLTKANEEIQDDGFYISIFLEFKDCLGEYFADLANGYWELPETTLGVAGICREIFLTCWRDEDIWELLYMYCPTKTACQIYKCYTGSSQIDDFYPVYLKDPVKAWRMLEYFAGKK